MLEQRKHIDELIPAMEVELRARGQSYRTQLYNLCCCQTIVTLHETRGVEYLDGNLIMEHIEHLQERVLNGEIGSRFYRGQVRNFRRVIEWADTGGVSWQNPRLGSTYELTAAFDAIANAYLAASNLHPNTKNDTRWVTHKYFVWLAEQGHEDLSEVTPVQLQKFLVFCSKTMGASSIHDVKLHLTKLYDYLALTGLTNEPYKALLSFRVNRESKIYPCVPKEDIAALLDVINRNTKRGKRDYAILLLGAVMGLRAIDVVNLKLSDIDWVRGEIKIVQAKTGKAVVLPLTQDVGEAIREYILKARPKSESKNIFLRIKAPHTGLRSAVTIGEIYNDWRRAAGLSDSKSFHSLRRTLARDMVTTGTPVTTVSQVLGHSEIDSVKKYIALDSRHLKLCALSFDGIAPIGGGVQ